MMNKYFKTFLQRGVAFGGLGPIIAGFIYVSLEHSIENFSLSGTEVCLAIITTYLLAFIQAGASVFNQIEEWPIAKSSLFHFASIYLAYVLCYIVNSWIPFELGVVAAFTAIFAAGYFAIWLIVYFSVKAASKKMNKKIGA